MAGMILRAWSVRFGMGVSGVLRFFAKRQGVVRRCEALTTMAGNTIRLHRVLRATPERVYRAFLDPDA